MTSLDMASVREGIGERVALWGGVPSVMLMPGATSDAAFESFLDESLARRDRIAAGGSGLIWGVSDNVPPDADLDRLVQVGERLSG